MERLVVKPERVRCQGNIVSPKSLSDFDLFSGVMSTGSDTVAGASSNVFVAGYLEGTELEVVSSSTFMFIIGMSSFPVSVRIRNNHGNIVTGLPVSVYLNDVLVDTLSSSNEIVLFNIPYTMGVDYYSLRFVCLGNDKYCGCSLSKQFNVINTEPGVSLVAESSTVEEGGSDNLLVRVTSTDRRNNIIGVPYQPVSVYELYEAGLKVTVDKSVIVSDMVSQVNVQLCDKDDGSLVREKDVPVTLYNKFNTVNSFADVDCSQLVDGTVSDGNLIIDDAATLNGGTNYEYISLGGNVESGRFICSFDMTVDSVPDNGMSLYFGVQSVNSRHVKKNLIAGGFTNKLWADMSYIDNNFINGNETSMNPPIGGYFNDGSNLSKSFTLKVTEKLLQVNDSSWGPTVNWNFDDLNLFIMFSTPTLKGIPKVTISNLKFKPLEGD